MLTSDHLVPKPPAGCFGPKDLFPVVASPFQRAEFLQIYELLPTHEKENKQVDRFVSSQPSKPLSFFFAEKLGGILFFILGPKVSLFPSLRKPNTDCFLESPSPQGDYCLRIQIQE